MLTVDKVTRKLRAILSADVKGYSLLMSDDEALTVKTLKFYRALMSEQIENHTGRVVDAPGDNLLAEFASVVNAVQCAVEIQKILKENNKDLPPDKRLEFRIGVNIGDVIQDGDSIYGAGVNVAARIEGLAEAGGICISRNAYDHVKDKLNYGYEYLGEHEVKNIKDPVRVYKVLTDQEDVGKLIGENPQRYRKKWPWLAVATVAFLIGIIVWQFSYEKLPSIEAASVENMVYPLPDKPSIAVLPFNNLSDNPVQDYIAVGITENIISALSNISDMFVIYSDSTSTYKGKHVKIKQVSEELGVRYVLEGSTQKSGNRLRVTAQLIDATTGRYLWSEKYDRDLKDLFVLQDEITHKIIVELQVELTEGEQARLSQKSTTNIEAWRYANRGLAIWMRISKENNAKAMELFEKAVELDPNYVWAWVKLAWTHSMAADPAWSQNPSEHLKMLLEISKKVLAMDESDSDVRALSGLAYLWQGELEKAIVEGEKAIVLDPANAQSHVLLSCSMNTVGRFDEVIRLVKKAMRLHPYYPAYYLTWLGGAYRMSGNYEDALTVYNQLLDRSLKGDFPPAHAHLFLADLYAEIGKEDEARTHAAEVLKIEPEFSLKVVKHINTYDYTDPALMERRLNALRKAGIPDNPPLPLPDKPSIAVLAFDNLSGDPEQEYFSDGIAEEIITALSKIRYLFVIARTSSFKYKRKDVDLRTVGRELGVSYVLEGSVRMTGDKVRITAQLIDAKTNNHIWAERYDRDLKDIFALQDEITMEIINSLQVELTEGEHARLWRKGTDNLEAYLKFLKARELYLTQTKENNAQAQRIAKEAIALDPEYPPPYHVLSVTHFYDIFLGTSKSAAESIKKAVESIQKAIALNDTYALAHGWLGNLYTMLLGEYDKGIMEAQKGVALDPNGAHNYLYLEVTLRWSGRHEEAVQAIEKAIRLNPFPPVTYYQHACMTYVFTNQYEKAIAAGEQALKVASPNDYSTRAALATAYILAGREEEARSMAKEILSINPKFSIQRGLKAVPYKNTSDSDLIAGALSKAGLPE